MNRNLLEYTNYQIMRSQLCDKWEHYYRTPLFCHINYTPFSSLMLCLPCNQLGSQIIINKYLKKAGTIFRSFTEVQIIGKHCSICTIKNKRFRLIFNSVSLFTLTCEDDCYLYLHIPTVYLITLLEQMYLDWNLPFMF